MRVQEVPHVVLVHGLWFRQQWLHWLALRLKDAGFVTKGFGYATTQVPLETSAERLFELCQRDFPRGAHLVGHSLGGLLILQMLRDSGWDRPGHLLFLGTPLAGSAVARRAAQWPGADTLLGHSIGPLAEGERDWPPGRLAGMIAGTRPLGLGVLTGGLEKPHDGTVSVAETRHPGLDAHIQLPVSHSGMLFSPAVARQAIGFLTRGRFSPVTET